MDLVFSYDSGCGLIFFGRFVIIRFELDEWAKDVLILIGIIIPDNRRSHMHTHTNINSPQMRVLSLQSTPLRLAFSVCLLCLCDLSPQQYSFGFVIHSRLLEIFQSSVRSDLPALLQLVDLQEGKHNNNNNNRLPMVEFLRHQKRKEHIGTDVFCVLVVLRSVWL